MNKKLYFLLKKLGVAACVGICLWCLAVKAEDWVSAKGAQALLFAAGVQVGAENTSEIPENTAQTPENNEKREENDLSLPDDGVVPFHSDTLPSLSPTPDPARASAPVEEIFLEGGQQVENFTVKDSTGSGTDLVEELKAPSPVALKADGTVEVLIYHTHTSEAYSQSFTGFYYTDMETRTGNKERSVVAVGEAMKAALEAAGIGVVHDTTVNDALYNGSYSRSWEVLEKNLAEHPEIQVTIDVHRDSMTTDGGVKYKPTVAINGRKAAQIMFIAGCDADGGWGDFPNWRENLRLILKAQQAVEAEYPGLSRPMMFSNSKYNMNATTGSMLIEVGTEVNTAAEAKYSGELVGKALAKLLKGG